MDFGKYLRSLLSGDTVPQMFRRYLTRFRRYAFTDLQCRDAVQYEASITRLYHTIEKGLSYENYRPGFGKANVSKLLTSLEQYAARFDTTAFFYETALSCLEAYVEKNKSHGHRDAALEDRIAKLPGHSNGLGGTIHAEPCADTSFDALMRSRHSIRHFSGVPVDVEVLKSAIALAQFTPSACNRQGWKTRIVADKAAMETVLANQNGNTGFGQEFDKLLVLTADLRYFQKSRELFQAYIDGGMYAESVLNALYAKGIGAVPLSASLKTSQETKIRSALHMHDAEVFLLIVGVGSYPPGGTTTTRSERHPAVVEII